MKLGRNKSFDLRNENKKASDESDVIYACRETGVCSLNVAVWDFEFLSPCTTSRVICTGCYFAAENPLQLRKSVRMWYVRGHLSVAFCFYLKANIPFQEGKG